MCRKLILFGCFVLMLGLLGVTTARGTTLVIPLAAQSDDAEETVSSGSVDLGSGDLDIPYEGDSPNPPLIVGLRFAGVQIPKGEIVKRAYVRFDADDSGQPRHAGETHVLIRGQLDPNAATFAATKNNVSARAKTAAVVEWNPAVWLTTHNKYWTSDVSSVLQEIVNQDGWAAGNALVLMINDNPSKPSVGMREAESFSGAGTNAGRLATLYIELGDIAAPDEIYREAESADVMGASWRLYDSPASFGGKHIGSQNGDGDENSLAPGAAWVAAYNFEAVGGVYKVVFRAQKNDSDSFWVRITGATSQTYENPAQAGTGWVKFNSMNIPGDAMGWDVVHSDDNNQDDVYWELPAGPHTIEIAKREDGVLLDCLVITNDLTLNEAALPGKGASELNMRITSGADDAEQHLNAGMDIGSTDLEIPYEDAGTPATDEQVTGIRFSGVLISKGGPIAGAYVEIEVDAVDKAGSAAPVNLVIEGELSPNAAAFANVANNITARPVTAAKVKWSIPPWTAVNAKFRSPNVSRIIREITSQNDWAIGNALVLIIRDDKDNPSTGLREAESFEGEAGAAPLLHLATLVPLAQNPSPANGATGVSPAAPVSTYFSTDVPKPVADRNFIPPDQTILGQAVSTLSVPDSFKVKDLNVELDISVVGQNADYNVYLKDPGGKQVELFTDVGKGSGFTNTILDDEASTSINGPRDPFTGRFKPESSLSGFDGRDAKGTWQLQIIDDWYGSSATLNSWRIVAEKPLLLSWTPPAGAASQNIYFSEKFEDVNSSAASALVKNAASDVSSYDLGALALGKTLYWRVTGADATGKAQASGPIWSFSTAAGNLAVSQRIAKGTDDVEERIGSNNGDMDITSTDLEMPYEDAGKVDPQIIGLRYVNVPLPAGVQVVGSSIEFTVDETKEGTKAVNLLIDAQLTPNAEAFADVANNISDRPTWTKAVVPWAAPNWTTVGQKSATPDLSAIITELIGQEGWASGNAVVFRIKDDPCNPSTGIRAADAYEDGATLCPLLSVAAISEAATQPTPADGAVNVPLATVLSWKPGLSAVWRTVYFGTTSSPAKLQMTTGKSLAPKLEPSTTYYWKVDEVDGSGKVTAGTVWSFTTPPGEATAPSPADFEAGVALDATLIWTAGITAVSHDVYFGTISPPPFIRNQAGAAFDPNVVDPNGLALGGVYYWRIDEKDAQGKKYIGNVWMFKAKRAGTGTILREVWENIGSGTKVSDLTGNSAYPSSPTFSDQRTLFETPTDFADNFGSRVHGYLHPDTSGEYTFWIASDDNSELWLSTDDRPANAVLISKVTNWADPRQWDDPDVIPSGPIHLEGGKKYYISALYKEGGGGDNCSVAWKGPDSPTRTVISGYFLSPFVALWAESPDPAVGTVLQQKFALLGWRAGVTAASHNVYISTNRDDVASGAAAAFAGNVTTTNLSVGLPGVPVPDGLVPGSTYYWRVDEVEANPTVVHEGAIWSFSVLPAKAHNPNPADGATGVATNKQLSWTPGLAAKLHSVYFGDNRDTVANAVGAPPLPLTTKNPGPLQPGKTYYWRVDEFNPPSLVKGDVWSFTTAP